MGNCAKLKWNRKRMGMSQKQFAEKVGVSVGTISRLELDESAWLTLHNTTEDKICAVFEAMATWQPEKADRVMKELASTEEESCTEEESEVVEEKKSVWPTEDITYEKAVKVVKETKNLHKRDEKTLTLMTTIWEWLNASMTHEEFEENINMMKNIIDHY